MNSQEALNISQSNKSANLDREYSEIIERIEHASKKGHTDIALGFTPPNQYLVDRLENEGYWIYQIGMHGILPMVYGVSWDPKPPEKTLSQKLFSAILPTMLKDFAIIFAFLFWILVGIASYVIISL